MQTLKGDLGKSTVSKETADLLYLLVRRFRTRTGENPILVLDNNRIQERIPDDRIVSRYGSIDLPSECRFRIPSYSPDFNQPAEHAVAEIKKQMRGLLFKRCAHSGQLASGDLQKIFNQAVGMLRKGMQYKGSVLKDVKGLVVLWGIVSTPKGQNFTELQYRNTPNPPKKAVHPGTGGGWPPARIR